MRLRSALLALAVASALVSAQEPQPQPQPETPRFRAGTNLVRVDVYATEKGQAALDLTAEDFEVFEDNAAQKIEIFEFVKPRAPVPQEQRTEPRSLLQSRQMAADPSVRLFVLFYDLQNVSIAGAYHANKSVFEFVNTVIGEDDMVGVLTSDMSPLDLTFARRTSAMERYFTANWAWGQRNQAVTTDPVEEALKTCYFGQRSASGGLDDLISRHREMKTLNALDGLVTHLDGIREERKFVVIFTEGWRLHQPDQRSASPVEGDVPQGPGVRIGSDGRLTTKEAEGSADYQACEQRRVMLAQADNNQEFQRIMQRANRANVSFYPVDGRGLQVYDERYRYNPAQVVATQTNARREALYRMAEATDGIAVVNTNDVSGGLARIVADTSSYYLLSYYSTNSRMDGGFRRIRVRVKKPGIAVRARPGYLAPTDAEARAGARTAAAASTPARLAPQEVTRALAGIDRRPGPSPIRAFRRGPSTGLAYQPVSEPQFRRTERVRIELAVGDAAEVTGRLLTRQGQALPLTVQASVKDGEGGERTGVAEVVLAPLAPGEYVIELVAQAPGTSTSTSTGTGTSTSTRTSTTTYYGFRIIP
jgi:VWFA-related protein